MKKSFPAAAALLLIPLLTLKSVPPAQLKTVVPFVRVSLGLSTTGSNQTEKNVGNFVSSFPLGETGHLDRKLNIVNSTRHRNLELKLFIGVTPRLDEAGTLHCVVVSTAKPETGKTVERFRDLAFTHPGAKLMELFSDEATGVHLLLSVSAELLASDEVPVSKSMPSIVFLVRSERWMGAQREKIESLQLQSLDGRTVTHDYSRKIPIWTTKAADDDEQKEPIEELPVLQMGKQAPVVKAGEGFTIVSDSKNKVKPASHGKNGQPDKKKPEKKLVWKREYYNLSITPMAFDGERLTVKINILGKVFNSISKKSLPPVNLDETKQLVNGQPLPLFLTHETKTGPAGYVLWVVPKWNEKKSAADRTAPESGNGVRDPVRGGSK